MSKLGFVVAVAALLAPQAFAGPQPDGTRSAQTTSGAGSHPEQRSSRAGNEAVNDDLEPRVNTSALPNPGAVPSASAPKPAPASESTPPGRNPPSPGASANAAGQSAAANVDSERPHTAVASKTQPQNRAKGGKAMDRLELDTTQITGNRELPKVLYIVPWKRADLGDLVGKPVNSLLDEALQPVDRDVFKRENRYYRAVAPAENATQRVGADAAGNAAAK